MTRMKNISTAPKPMSHIMHQSVWKLFSPKFAYARRALPNLSYVACSGCALNKDSISWLAQDGPWRRVLSVWFTAHHYGGCGVGSGNLPHVDRLPQTLSCTRLVVAVISE
jgi:hypothetical protein